MKINHHNPENMYRSPVFSQAVSIDGPAKLIFVGGQDGVDASGKIVSEEVGAQTEQALRNLLEVLKSVGATQENVVKLTIYLEQNQDFGAAYASAQKVWGSHPTTITGMRVTGLGVPGALVEIDAVAAVEGERDERK